MTMSVCVLRSAHRPCCMTDVRVHICNNKPLCNCVAPTMYALSLIMSCYSIFHYVEKLCCVLEVHLYGRVGSLHLVDMTK